MWDGRRELNGREASRWSSVGEESADVRCESLEESGGDSGTGTVRARPMLQALAPRSRTLGRWRLMS